MGQLTVATCQRGRAALDGIDSIRVAGWGDSFAQVAWRRAPTTGEDVETAVATMPALRWLHTDSHGVDGLPLRLLAARNVTVTKTVAYTQPVAEWIVTAVLMAAKRADLYAVASAQKELLADLPPARMVAGSRALIVGQGAIGRAAADRLTALGVSVQTAGRDHAPLAGYRTKPDWLILACPLTAETTGLIGSKELAMLNDGAWLINVGRDQLVVSRSLNTALATGRLGGAVLDTDHAVNWQGRPNVIALPHITWKARGVGRAQVGSFLQQLARYQAGRPLAGVVDLALGY